MFRVHSVSQRPNLRQPGWAARGSRKPAGSSEF